MLTGLSAFPLTPIRDDRVDERAFVGLVERLVTAEVDSIGALGSTGAYPYLTRDERRRVARLAVDHAGAVPVVVGIGALRTTDVLACAEDAQAAGAAGLLLAPVSYQPLTPDEVHGLFEQVTAAVDVPVIVYDNPNALLLPPMLVAPGPQGYAVKRRNPATGEVAPVPVTLGERLPEGVEIRSGLNPGDVVVP